MIFHDLPIEHGDFPVRTLFTLGATSNNSFRRKASDSWRGSIKHEWRFYEWEHHL